ncbi:MAG: 30S ribosome-binding factor RbfA [Chloroflexota bacterium]|nr:MAG: 30S ribosome-binding factor RbfA [Chloroflexota bacterium]
MTQRTDRVDELLRQEIGQLLAREVADPRIGFATITDVETTPDLRHAKVWVSVIGTDAERNAAVAALAHAVPFIRHELGVRLRIKRIPDLHVRLDETSERGTRVLRLINELEAGSAAGAEDGPTEEVLPTPVARLPHEGDAPVEPPIPEPPTSERRPPRRQRARQSGGHAGGGAGRDGGSRASRKGRR